MNSILLSKAVMTAVLALGTSFSTTAPMVEFEPHMIQGSLTRHNPVGLVRPGSHAVIHTINVRRGEFYEITVKNAQFDPCVVIQDATGKTLTATANNANGNNANGNRTTHVRFRASQSGTFRIVVTSLQQHATGNYQLEVVNMFVGC